MKSLLKSLCLVLAGTCLGWWLNYNSSTPYKESVPVASLAAPAQTRPSSASGSDLQTINQVESTAFSGSAKLPSAAALRQLLTQQEYELALAYYEQALLLDDGYQTLLKPVIESYLLEALQQYGNGNFLDLVNLWLGSYYQDIPVLLILAESQRLYGTPEEAASTLQLASAYALETGQQEDVSSSVQALVKSTDEMLSSQQSWIALLGFYEFLEIVDLGAPAYRLRQSSLYQMLGEQQRSREVLMMLQEGDDGMNSEWTAMLASRLARHEPESAADQPQRHAMPVTRSGEHFIVASTVNGSDQLNLMIDTGASLTTVSKTSFKKMPSSYFQYQGSRMFNTANGLTQGDVYRAASIELGNVSAEMVDIAVLDYQPSAGIDGLLGMNVLRNFRFEIDQDNNLLYLRPRR